MHSEESLHGARSEAAPDSASRAAPGTPSSGPGDILGLEAREREMALQRGALPRDPYAGIAPPAVAHRAFAALAENVRDYAIFLIDPDGVITFWGEGARLIKWWTKEQAEGAHLRLLYPSGGSEDGTAEEHLKAAAETGEYTGEGQRIRSDGSTFWAGITLTAIRDFDDTLLGFVKVTRDLTARRAADAALNAAVEEAEGARKQAEEASSAKSSFLATMSHEIRTPMNAIMGYAELLEMGIGGPLTKEQREQLAGIRTSNVHLLGIIDEILDFSRLEAGRVSVGGEAGRLGEPTAAALKMVRMQAEAKGVELTDHVSGFSADVPYWGDEDRVRQILVILLANAVKFTPPGGRITMSGGTTQDRPPDAQLDGPGPWVYVRIDDTGEGIPPNRIEEIFEPFEQADMSLTRQHGGTGLGLTIARRLTRLMHGDLTVRAEQGVGSTFFVWLPGAAEESLRTKLSRRDSMDPPGPQLLQDVNEAILREVDRILHAYVARLRSDPDLPSATNLPASELEDHLASFLGDLAETFGDLDLAAGPQGDAVHTGTVQLRRAAEAHGLQRYRLGWSEAEIRREFEILREEVAAAIERQVHDVPPEELKVALEAVGTFITTAEKVSLASYRSAAGQDERTG